jgi:hypothetical protein
LICFSEHIKGTLHDTNIYLGGFYL